MMYSRAVLARLFPTQDCGSRKNNTKHHSSLHNQAVSSSSSTYSNHDTRHRIDAENTSARKKWHWKSRESIAEPPAFPKIVPEKVWEQKESKKRLRRTLIRRSTKMGRCSLAIKFQNRKDFRFGCARCWLGLVCSTTHISRTKDAGQKDDRTNITSEYIASKTIGLAGNRTQNLLQLRTAVKQC